MNYTIYSDDHLIYNRMIVDGHAEMPYSIITPELDLSNDKFGALTYKAMKGTPGYEHVGHITSKIKIYRDGVLYWTGRVFGVSPVINNIVTVTCEDFLGVLNDSIVRPYEWSGTAAGLLEYLVNQHNAQITSTDRMISAVVCDVTDNINRSSTIYETTWANVKGKLIDMLGGYMWIEYDDDENAILYYSRRSKSQVHDRSTQDIKFARNIIDYKVDLSAGSFYTACVPIGATYEVGTGAENDPKRSVRLTIAEVNDGKDYLINTEAAETYGILYAPVSETTWDDVTLASNLLERGQEWIREKSARYVRSISLTAADLHGIDADVPELDWLDSVRCVAPDFDETMVLKSIKRDLSDPYKASLQLGDTFTSLSGKTASNAVSTAERIERIESDYVTTGDARTVAEETIENSSTIQQLPESIMSTVSELYTSKSEFEEYSQMTSTQISQLPNELQILFTQILEDGGLTELSAYLRVLNGNLHLGRSSSEIKACLKNDILIFYTGADENASIETSLAYFSSGKLFVNTVQIESLTLGVTGSSFDIRVVGEGQNRCLFFSGRGA